MYSAALSLIAAEPDVSKLPAPSTAPVEFSRDIQAIFEKSCLRCHGPEKPKSRFRLDNRESALKGGEHGVDILPGESAKSPLIHFVAGLVADMEMPPRGKGEPLTPEQIGKLRAWIDVGAPWPAATNTTNYSYGIAMFVRGVSVSGSKPSFREHLGMREGAADGVEWFDLSQQLDTDTRLTVSGRVAPVDRDYRAKFAWERNDAGFVRAGFEQFRTYYDDTGGYYAPFAAPSFALGRDLHLDTGKAWIELGLTRPDLPRMVLGYEYHYRDGAKSMLFWGDSTQGGVDRAIYPAFKEISERVHVVRFDVEHEQGATRVENNFRAEVTDLATRTVMGSDFTAAAPTPTAFTIVRETHGDLQAMDSLHVTHELNDWLHGTAGYYYARVSADASFQQSTVDTAGATAFGEQWFSNQILLERESHLMSVSALLGPWSELTFSAAVQGELTRQRTFGNVNYQVGLPNVFLIPDPATLTGNSDTRAVAENFALRWTGLPRTVVFVEGRFQQENRGIFEQQIGGAEPFTRNTDATGDVKEWRAGFHTAPFERITFAANYKRRDNRTDYENLQHDTTGHPYPGFLRFRDAETDEVEARLTWRASSWWRTTLGYKLTATDYTTATDALIFPGPTVLSPGGSIFAGNYDAHVWSVGQTLTPWRRWLFNATLSYADTRLSTAQNGADYVVPYRGGVWSVLGNATWAVNETTDLHANYSWSLANYGQNNAAAGLPAGVNYEQHGLLAGASKRFNRTVSGQLQYGFFKYREPTGGTAYDYTAHGVFATLNFRWP